MNWKHLPEIHRHNISMAIHGGSHPLHAGEDFRQVLPIHISQNLWDNNEVIPA